MSKITDYTDVSNATADGDWLVTVDISDTSMDASGTTKKLTALNLKNYVKAGPVTAVGQPGNPAATASATLVMMGVGTTCKITPGSSGKVQVALRCLALTNTALVNFTVGLRFGTGTAPIAGAAVTGTRWGAAADDVLFGSKIAVGLPVSWTDLLTLTPATAYWFDVALLTSVGADTAAVTNISFVAEELS